MKENVTLNVATCPQCRRSYEIGEEGDGEVCDSCKDVQIRDGAWGHPFQPVEEELKSAPV